MELPLGFQGAQFLIAAALGALYGLHYDFLYGLRKNCGLLTHLLDLWFVLSCLLGNLLFALYIGNGEYRIFMLFGTLVGVGVYFLAFRRLFRSLFDRLFWLLTFPIRKFWGFLRKIFKKCKLFLKNLFSKKKKSVTIEDGHYQTPIYEGQEAN